MTVDELKQLMGREWNVTLLGKRYLTVWGPGVLATIDIDLRCWRAGGQVTQGQTIGEPKYGGRGWKRRLAGDVVAWIDRMVKP